MISNGRRSSVADLTPEQLRTMLQRDRPGSVMSALSRGTDDTADHPHGTPADLLATNETIIVAERLLDVVLYVRDQLGYTYLSDIAVVDYLDYDLFELVYSFYHLDGGGRLVLKARVPRDTPIIESLTPFWPGAELNEREAYDLFGIRFTGHPDLSRIYMWDEFEGFPMRKDFPKQGDKYFDGS